MCREDRTRDTGPRGETRRVFSIKLSIKPAQCQTPLRPPSYQPYQVSQAKLCYNSITTIHLTLHRKSDIVIPMFIKQPSIPTVHFIVPIIFNKSRNYFCNEEYLNCQYLITALGLKFNTQYYKRIWGVWG